MSAKWSLVFALSVAVHTADADVRLIEAVKNLDRTAVRGLIDRGIDVNSPAPDGATALHWAAYEDDPATVALLIGAGAKVNVANRNGMTPLLLAATNGNAAVIDALLKAKADPNVASPEGETPLMVASRTGKVDAVRALLVAGVNVNAKENWRGQTALMWAASEGHAATAAMLIEFGADIRVRSRVGFSPFLFAVRDGRSDVARLLLKAGVDVNETLPSRSRRNQQTPGASSSGPSSLDLAVSNAHFELAAMLLDAGADPNASGPGWTPLHTITWVRKPGAGSNDPAPRGSGTMSSLDLVRKLVEKGADVNARMTRRTTAGLSSLNMIGATPFLMAARTGDPELMRLLVKLGADPLLPNADNSTPLLVAAGLGTRSPGEDAGTEGEALEAVKLALELGNDVNAVDKRGDTALHGAAYKHLPSVAQFLIDHGAKVEVWNRKNHLGWTPLRIAVGVHRGMNLRSSPATAAVLSKVMSAAGLSTEVEPEAVISGATQ